jgi:hypothetical protein
MVPGSPGDAGTLPAALKEEPSALKGGRPMTEPAMRGVECVCGEHLEARNDTALLEEYRTHCQADHPEWSEAEIKASVVKNAYDNVPIEARRA